MWTTLGKWILRYQNPLFILLLAITGFMGWRATHVKLSYEFAKAIPTDNPRYQAYQAFRRQFGDDGNMMVIGIQKKDLFAPASFSAYQHLVQTLKGKPAVEEVLSVVTAINLVKDDSTEKLKAALIFPQQEAPASSIDSAAQIFLSLPFYRGFLYNPETQSWLMAVKLNSVQVNSPLRTKIVADIMATVDSFSALTHTDVHVSGLPYIRTITSDRIQKEMRFFLVGSVLLSALILLLFFRSWSSVLLSLAVVIMGVIWSVGILDLSGYKITILTALIPPLVVVIGIPNCIYFLNKFHSHYRETRNKQEAMMAMIGKMGVVTLFCNIAAAIGFAVFALTRSAILREFGVVAGISIFLLFIISLILIPFVLSKVAAPAESHMRYLDNRWLQRGLDRLEIWSLGHRRSIYGATVVLLTVAVAGILRLQSVGYIVDDIPKKDRIYTDLKFFDTHFGGVMPLEIVIDTRKKYGVTRNLKNLEKIDELVQYLNNRPDMGKPLAITQGLKFAKQAFFEGDSNYYMMPGENDLLALKPYLSGNSGGEQKNTAFSRIMTSFMDSSRQKARISVNMKDVGSARLPEVLDSIAVASSKIFDTAKYDVQFTGTSVTFLEGSRFIINGLKESVFWAFLLIALCMLYLFRSLRILFCSLLPNLIPLVITAGVMGWAGVPLKPSTVLVFSVALGIAIDITIRFLVNYKQQLAENNGLVEKTVIDTIHSTGLSIVYTSVVLIAGFIIFCLSGFGGTKALGWLTSLTLITATLANLVLLPALLISLQGKKKESSNL